MKPEPKANLRKQAWQAARRRYTWHLRAPFKSNFDCSRWWVRSSIEPAAALHELARRHPWVGEVLLGKTTSPESSGMDTVKRRKLGRFVLVLAMSLANTGCGSFMARRMVQAPNTYPSWFAPRAPVELVFGADYLTNFPARFADVGPPAARLCYRVVEPGDYHLEVSRASWLERGYPRCQFTFHATVPGSPTGFTASPRGTLVLLHCYGMTKTVMAPWALRLAQEGWRCVLVDLRGHGKSTGRQISFGVHEVRDLSQLLGELARDGRLAEPVAVLGYSYGAALALRWETVEPRVRKVVAIAPYAELSRAVLNVRRDYARWIPEACVKAGLNRLPGLLKVEPGELDTTTLLARAPVPALFVAGGLDDLTRVSDVGRLHTLAATGSQLLVVPQATHESLPYWLDDLADPVLTWLVGAPPVVEGGEAGAARCGRNREGEPKARGGRVDERRLHARDPVPAHAGLGVGAISRSGPPC